MYDVVIVGAGTAGLSAAIYALRAGKRTLVLEKGSMGGQIVVTPEVENYPGISKISGFAFAQGIYDQATALGMEYVNAAVTGVMEKQRDGQRYFEVHTGKSEDKVYEAKTVILATGAKNRPLDIDREQDFVGQGISYCATCDGMFYRDRDVAVVGGGNTALEDALFLANYCHRVYLIHRREEFRGEEKKLEALKQKDNVEIIVNSVVTGLISEEDDEMDGVLLWNRVEKKERKLYVAGLFIAVGQMPDNDAFAGLVQLDEQGYIQAGEDCLTGTDGIFTAGDCRTKKVRQLTTAAADGAVAALAACEYLG